MKTLIIALVLCPMMLSAQAARTATYTIGNSVQECRGRGLCDVKLTDGTLNSNSDAGKISSQNFILKIRRESLTEDDEIKLMGKLLKDIKPDEKVFFIQQNELRIQDENTAWRSSGSDKKVIAAGRYPVQITNDHIEIMFTLNHPKQ